ncbi:hypothetical protein [Saccharibacillus kuerlensis]|uniref:Haloacid dehalogenase n=1 Tax=Saccharibacillus kuerlensis TaxID=459527 RepID=A0ABQ2KTF0_9BACL|nr:hypothetical protein [Saccharibacillus kuerlensis]GGN90987.1 hypothetical protein GCM10010969_02000 [Saccharibacillus kuerlensis]
MNAEARTRLQLVFDVGGVLADNLDHFWSGLAQEEAIDRTFLRAQYKKEIGSGLWQGTIVEDEFWNWLREVCPNVPSVRAKELLKQTLIPLPALGRLEGWSERADIHILSNHVASWIMPLLEGQEDRISSITVSSEAGFHKPDIRLFRVASLHLMGSEICFVDDKEDNLETARMMGWDTLLADPEGKWIQEVEDRLKVYE